MNAEERQLEIARSLFREANDAFFLFDPLTQRVVDLNPSAQRMTGREKHAACSMSLRDLFSSASAEGLERLVQALHRPGCFHSREGYHLLRGSDKPLPVNLSASRVHTDPEPIGLVVARDISEQRRAEEDLKQAETRYKCLVDSTGVVVWELDGTGVLVVLGSTFEPITGWRRGDWLGRPFDDLLHPDDVEMARHLFLRAREGNPLPRFELRIRTRNGGFLHSEFLLVSRVRSDSEDRILGISRDITEQKRLEQTLEQAESLRKAKEQAELASHAKSEFLSNVSHEIRTPLSALLGFVELLGEHPFLHEAPTQVHGYLGAIQNHGQVLLALVDDLLDLARIEAGRDHLIHGNCRLPRLLEDLVESFRARALAKGLRLESRTNGDVPPIVATDRLPVQQILVNLLDNVFKFTVRGAIVLSAQVEAGDSPDPRLQIQVSDTGIGMTRDEMEGLFQPFYRIRQRPRDGPRGTGLGLAICQRLAHQLGGDVTVQSVPGSGSRFTLTVPVHLPAEQGDLSAPGPTHPRRPLPAADVVHASRLNARILLAEDHDGNRQIIELRLSRASAEVVTARNGAEALARVRQAEQSGRPFDAVIMDMEMPVLDGYEAVRQLRASGFPAPIVAVTAYAMTKDRQECLSLGCNEHVSKPIDWALLLNRLSELLQSGIKTQTSEDQARKDFG
jgi:PAS domain S-box-containing protein